MLLALKSVLDSLRSGKTEGKFYAEFSFLGGNTSFLIGEDQASGLRGKEGQEFILSVQVRPRPVILFDRPVTLFESVKLVEFSTNQPPKMPQTK